jgi:hypothetical protein
MAGFGRKRCIGLAIRPHAAEIVVRIERMHEAILSLFFLSLAVIVAAAVTVTFLILLTTATLIFLAATNLILLRGVLVEVLVRISPWIHPVAAEKFNKAVRKPSICIPEKVDFLLERFEVINGNVAFGLIEHLPVKWHRDGGEDRHNRNHDQELQQREAPLESPSLLNPVHYHAQEAGPLPSIVYFNRRPAGKGY